MSYGGIQSNSMLALSQIAQLNQKYNFTYFSRKIPRFLKKTPIGNYQRALQYGMKVIELDNAKYEDMVSGNGNDIEMIMRQHSMNVETVNFIKQGGISEDAEIGLQTLAIEIVNFVRYSSFQCQSNKKNGWCVFVAGNYSVRDIWICNSL